MDYVSRAQSAVRSGGEHFVLNPTSATSPVVSPIEPEFSEIGQHLVEAGKYAVITVAGGAGTRLGCSGPKGTVLVEGKPLFCYLLDQFRDVEATVIHWLIMTSPSNHDETVEFFSTLSIPENLILIFFKQRELPCFLSNGEIALFSDGQSRPAATGHGGLLDAVVSNGLFETYPLLHQVDVFFYCHVDNPLVQLFNYSVIGRFVKDGAKMGAITFPKLDPDERVGTFVSLNGVLHVVEYSELSAALKEQFLLGSVGIQLFSGSFFRAVCFGDNLLPFHLAHKEVEGMDVVKAEQFIFDLFPFAGADYLLLCGERLDWFAPLKNREGADSFETVSIALNHRDTHHVL